MRLLTPIFILLWSLIISGLASAAESPVVDTGRVNAQLVSNYDAAMPGDEIYVALDTILDPEWHTYWLNPGDSGERVQIQWELPEGYEPGEIIWPLPYAIPTGPLINYGFDDRAIFPLPLKIPESATIGERVIIKANAYYLVCKDVCIPENTDLSLELQIGEPVIDGRWNDVIKLAKLAAPKLGTVTGGIFKDGGDAVYRFTDLPDGDFSEAYFFPEAQGVIEHSAPQRISLAENGLQIETMAGFDWKNGTPENINGVLSYQTGGKTVGTKVALQTDVPDIGIITTIAAPVPAAGSGIAKLGFFGAIIGAFLGGLILNIMPCVFPVISIKALSIAKSGGEDRKAIRRDAWAYTIGILVSFLILTLILLALKAGGNEIGWGFQLQDPRVVGVLALLLFAVGLNLLGVFEIAGGFQNTGQALTQKSGFSGSFFTGVLATIVATPCTAPLMAGAIGYAFTQSALVTVLVFMALGLGFALPFLLIAYIPGLSQKLPKPGPWMVRFKEFLAFPMFAAAIWLVWVATQQAGEMGLRYILAAGLLLSFAIWLLKQRSGLTKILAGAAFIGAAALPLSLHAQSVATHGEAWSNDKVAELRADGQAVFVDFTAAWCVSCKVNEIRVLNSEDIQKLFRDTNTAFLIADWTNKNDIIARELEKYGRAGVPLYLYYPPGKNDVTPEILPQILTKDMLRDTLQGT